jgi:hypothetical protein
MNTERWWCDNDREILKYSAQYLSQRQATLSTKISDGLARDLTLVSAMSGRRLTASAIAGTFNIVITMLTYLHTLKMEAVCSSEMVENLHQAT